jgi:hypothetical protein
MLLKEKSVLLILAGVLYAKKFDGLTTYFIIAQAV